jgi:hypothetical protein
MNKYDVLFDLSFAHESEKRVKSWIAALSDGEYLAKFDYSEDAVNGAVEVLEALNDQYFAVYNDISNAKLYHGIGYDALMDVLEDLAVEGGDPVVAVGVLKPGFGVVLMSRGKCSEVVSFLSVMYLIKKLDL